MTRRAIVMALMWAGLGGAGCEDGIVGAGGYADAPQVQLTLFSADEIQLGARIPLQLRASGCDSGIESVVIEQQGEPILRLTPDVDGRVDVFPELPVEALELVGAEWPVAVEVEATLTCRSGARIQTPALALEVVPAAEQAGTGDAPWPSYTFWPGSDGLLFCAERSLVRLDGARVQRATSPAVMRCGAESQLHRRGDRLVLQNGESVAVLTRDDLSLVGLFESEAIAVGQTQLVLLDRTSDRGGAPLRVQSIALEDGGVSWEAILDAPGLDSPLAPAYIDHRTGEVTVLTLAIESEPFAGHYHRWTLDAERAVMPVSTRVGGPALVDVGSGDAIVVQQGYLFGPDTAMVIEGGVQGLPTTMSLLDLESQTLSWMVEMPHRPWLVPVADGGLLAHAGPRLLWIAPDGMLRGRYSVPAGYTISSPVAHPDGGVVTRVRSEDGDDGALVFLDRDMAEVWSLPGTLGLGAAFDDDGVPWLVGRELVRLFDAETYRELLR